MSIAAKKISITESLEVVYFYLNLLRQAPFQVSFMVFLGFLTRALSVLIFVLIVKVFLSVIDPDSVLKVINSMPELVIFQELSSAKFVYILVSVLLSLVLLQFLLAKFHLIIFLKIRTYLITILLNKPLNEHAPTHLHICLDKIPQGYDAIIKSAEILLFYVFLFLGIFYINPLAGVLLTLLVPIILVLILYKGRKEVHNQAAMLDSRKQVSDTNEGVDDFLSLFNQNYIHGRNSVIYSDFLGGAAIILLMIVFMFWYKNAELGFGGLTALFFVFSMRFAILYAGELSRFISKLLQQRVMIEKIQHKPFK